MVEIQPLKNKVVTKAKINTVFQFLKNKVISRPVIECFLTVEGMKKEKKMNVAYTYCPFCGRPFQAAIDQANIEKAVVGARSLEKFNEEFKVGDKVVVIDDHGNEFIDEIEHEASLMGGHTNVAWLKGKGSYQMSRVIRKEVANG